MLPWPDLTEDEWREALGLPKPKNAAKKRLLTHDVADPRVPGMAARFRTEVDQWRTGIDERALTQALGVRDTERAVLLLDPPYDFLSRTPIAAVYRAAAERTVNNVRRKLRVGSLRVAEVQPFDGTNPRAQAFPRERAGRLISDVTDSFRSAVRNRVEEAYADNVPPEDLATQLVHEGLGLDEGRMGAVVNYRADLVDKGAVEGEELDAEVGRYYNDKLAERALTIAQTELGMAADEGQLEAWTQLAESGAIGSGATRTWVVTDDDRCCEDVCRPMDGETVGLDEPWTLPDGREVMIPAEAHPNDRCGQELSGAVSSED